MQKVIDKKRYLARLKTKISVLKADIKYYKKANVFLQAYDCKTKIEIYTNEIAMLEKGDYDKED